MKASELITKLQALVAEFGDLPVVAIQDNKQIANSWFCENDEDMTIFIALDVE